MWWEDADAVDPIELAFQLIRVIDAEVAEGGVLRTGTTAAFGGGGQGLLTQVDAGHVCLWVQVGDVLGADPRAAACIQHPHGLGFGFGPGTEAVGRIPIPAPVIAGGRLVQNRLRRERIGVVEAGDGVGDGLGVRH